MTIDNFTFKPLKQCEIKRGDVYPIPKEGDLFTVTELGSQWEGQCFKVDGLDKFSYIRFFPVSETHTELNYICFYSFSTWRRSGILSFSDCEEKQDLIKPTQDLCPNCNTPGSWVALAMKCPKCWTVW
jgi:hypothetical protein